MRVYKILSSDDYPALIVKDYGEVLKITTSAGFCGNSLVNRWKPIPCRVEKSPQKPGQFMPFTLGTFAFTTAVLEEFGELFRSVGEVLPIDVSGKPHYLIDVTRTADVVDREKTNPRILRFESVPRYEGIAFKPERLEQETLFFVRELPSVLLTTSGHRDPSKDFYARCTALGFKGIEFDLVWSDDL
jgi:hypothetical protein